MSVQRRVNSATAGLQLQRLQFGVPSESGSKTLFLPTILLSFYERNIVLASRAFMSQAKQLAS